ncbi:MAG: Gfo/Idh/MocA family oxidoreductase [Chitinophagaceae bacterium]|nr:Gfo/Idh/MocA family oxidoreductase [Chitinophagaceae bacterium]
MKNFVLIGAAGYIAPRHMKAIKETGNQLVAALDKNDSVGILDTYFPKADFFTEFERFDRHCEKLKRSGTTIDYVVVCSPNYLHDAHIRFGLRLGADVICEKPVVLNPWNVDALLEMEKETGKNVYPVLQLRYHPAIIALREKIINSPAGKKFEVDLKYITSRGNWYHHSWKGNIDKSGGIATNIGLHFFDVLLWIFGEVKHSDVWKHDLVNASGVLQFENATVSWMLSIEESKLPEKVRQAGKSTYRLLTVDKEEVEFSDGFAELHTDAYRHILAGAGVRLAETKEVTMFLSELRRQKIS